jgi:peptidoglycan-N-acetylglucosamine deacetylase
MRRFALTFDDGPGPSTAELLDVLRDAGVKATFFVLGKNIVEAPWCGGDEARARALVVRALREGHVIGNHSHSHGRPDKHPSLADEVRRVDRLLAELVAEAGLAPRPIPFRLPYGIRLVDVTVRSEEGSHAAARLDPRLAVLASLGRTHVHWTSDFDDWTLGASEGARLGSEMIAHIEASGRRGLDAVLDLHDAGTGSAWGYARPATVTGVATLLVHAKINGWSTFTVPA